MSYICPVTPPTRSEEVVETLRARLADGTWPVGTRLPGEHALSDELGVGRNTIREALRSLVNAGLLRARRGDGTYVIATDELEAALSRRVGTEEAVRLLEVRMALEVECEALAALRATDAERANMLRLLHARDEAAAGDDEALFLRADLAWHESVARSADNPLLLQLYLGLDRPATYARHPEAMALQRDAHELTGTHSAVMDAILARDPAAARAAGRRLADASMALVRGADDAPRPSRAPADSPTDSPADSPRPTP